MRLEVFLCFLPGRLSRGLVPILRDEPAPHASAQSFRLCKMIQKKEAPKLEPLPLLVGTTRLSAMIFGWGGSQRKPNRQRRFAFYTDPLTRSSPRHGSMQKALQLLLKGFALVGTTRFELATSPTPRVRSTRLSHVPTEVTGGAASKGGAGSISYASGSIVHVAAWNQPFATNAVVHIRTGRFVSHAATFGIRKREPFSTLYSWKLKWKCTHPPTISRPTLCNPCPCIQEKLAGGEIPHLRYRK